MATPNELLAGVVPAATVAERYAATTGITEVTPAYFSDPSAVQVHHRAFGRDGDFAGILTHDPLSGAVAGGVVGTYDPAINRWRFFPEVVMADEARPLQRLYAGHLGPLAARAGAAEADELGETFLDVFGEQTRAVRHNLHGQLRGLDTIGLLERPGVVDNLSDLNDAPGPVLETDQATIVFPTLSIGGSAQVDIERLGLDDGITHGADAVLQPVARLTLMYQNVIVASPGHPGRRIRSARQLIVARRGEGDVLVPELGVIGMDEWTPLRNVAATLVSAANNIPNFSPMHCAVARRALDLPT